MPRVDRSSSLRQMIDKVCDGAGGYEEFHVSWLMDWFPTEQQLARDAVRQLVKEGLLKQLGEGLYKWQLPKEGEKNHEKE